MTYEELKELVTSMMSEDRILSPVEEVIEDYDKIVNAYGELTSELAELKADNQVKEAKISELRDKLKNNWLTVSRTPEETEKDEYLEEITNIEIEDLK